MGKEHVELICSIGELAGLFEKAASLEDFLQTAVSIVAYHMRAAVCSVYLYDDDKQELVLTANQGLNPYSIGRLKLKLGEGLVGMALKELRPIREGSAQRSIGYKSVSWQEASKDLLDTLAVRNIIMYTVVGAILLVACFGIYNVISTVVLEKTRDIAILKSMGFHARDIRLVFVIEGAVIGFGGSLLGMAMGGAMMRAMEHVEVKVPGSTEAINLPVYWGADQFALAAAFAILSAVFAAWLPARKGGRLQPVDILRGAA